MLADARALTDCRTDAGARLANAVEALLPQLGMPDGRFSVQLVQRDQIISTGSEDVEFLVSLNVGHEPRALARVASGGELSRVMLALKTIVARLDHTPTLVFDEVDAGIGGRVGLQIGDAMRALAAHHQVLAISHLPQIAARAHHHIVVTKSASSGITTADTHSVENEARVAEIARMLGGDTGSELGLAHARELLSAAVAPPAKPTRRKLNRRKRETGNGKRETES
jgi:DNA repair protein RecN (Recombination protein N)